MTFRDHRPQCLSCEAGLAHVGTRWTCEQCSAALVTASELDELMNETSPDDLRPLALRLRPRSGPARTCPCCRAGMTGYFMGDVAIDRCSEHGVWFDKDELAQVLQANATAYGIRDPGRPLPALAAIPLGLGMLIEPFVRPWILRRRLRAHIARTSPED